MVHLAAAMGIPLLPQTYMIPVSRPEYLPLDEPKRNMEWGIDPGEVFLRNNPSFKLHHMYDPNQDRLTLEKISYFRVKMQHMLLEYERFISNNLEEGGTIIVSDCTRKWPVTTINDRFIFQFGALGGATEEEFLQGGDRVTKYLEKYNSHLRQWDSPDPDSDQPEAEWGFDRTLMKDIESLAQRNGYKVQRIVYNEPEHPSPFIAELYRWWYRQKGVIVNRLVAESFFLHEPYWILKTGSVPFWMKFNMDPSADWLEHYLNSTDEYDEIFLMLFSHGVEAIGLATPDRWKAILQKARKKHDFLGVDTENFPLDMGAMIKYNTEFKKKIQSRYSFNVPLTLDQVFEFKRQFNNKEFSDLVEMDTDTSKTSKNHEKEKKSRKDDEKGVVKEEQVIKAVKEDQQFENQRRTNDPPLGKETRKDQGSGKKDF
jgi:hypothetical protein